MNENKNIVLMGDKINEFTPKNFTFFTKPTYYDMSELKLEGLKKFAEIIQWGRRNPVKFCERFFGIEFLDYQKYVFMMSWITPNVVWCMSRNAGKTTLGSPFLMAKTMLLPKFEAYILSSTGSQSIGMMKKIESIAKKEIASFTGLTDVFLNELVKSANSEGFRHDPASYSFKLYSGSSLATVNSNFDGSRGRRSRLNFYDEASYVSEDMFAATLPFVTQNSDFALGGDVDVTLLPPNFPNQVICASSAGSMDDVFYKRYKEAAMHSMAGDKNYFCADIDCEVILHATYNGKIYPVPLLTQVTETEEESEETSEEETKTTEEVEETQEVAEEETEDTTTTESETESFSKDELFNKLFDISFEDIKYALNALCSIYRNDSEWCYVSQVYDEYFIMQDWDSDKYYKQSYTRDEDNIALAGERTEMFAMLLTESEKISIEEMRSNYAELKAFKEEIELNELREKKKEILDSEKYEILAQKDEEGKFVNKDYEKLVSEMDNYSLADLETEIKVLHSDYVSEHGNFALSNNKEKTATSKKQFVNVNKKASKPSRYGKLFAEEEK